MADLEDTSLFISARPTVSLESKEEGELTDALLNMVVEETTSGMYRCEVTFGNWGTADNGADYIYFDRTLLDFGKKISLLTGDMEKTFRIFEGIIMAFEANYPQNHPPEIVVLAEDRLQDLRMTRRTRTFEKNVTDRSVMEQIASEHSLKTDIDIDGPTYQILAQVNQSDLAFIRERARATDAQIWIEGETLNAVARSRRNEGKVTLTYGKGLREFSVLADLACQRSSISVSGWDVSVKELINHKAEESAISAELNNGQSGSTLLQNATGKRDEQIVHMNPHNFEEARTMAEACYRRMSRRFITGRAVADGDGRIRVGTYVDLKGLGPLFKGEYYVTEVRHTFDGRIGYRTHFNVERPGLGQ